MKSVLSAFLLCLGLIGFAQAPPQGISYQAVARDLNGQILNDALLVARMNILANGENGTLMWQETHSVTTDAYGLFSLIIGQGESTGFGNSPSFDLINWGAAAYWLNVEIDPGDGIFELMGSSQFLSVPYAFYAESSGSSTDDDPDPQNELITNMYLDSDSLIIQEGGNTHIVDLGDAIGDNILTDECISIAQLQGTDLNIVECGQAYVIPLESLVDDGDWIQTESAVYNDALPIGVGTDTPTSTLDVKGSLAVQVTTVDGPVNVNLDDNTHVVIANTTFGDVTLNLPSATTCPGRLYRFKIFASAGNNDFQLITQGSETVDGLDDPTIFGADNLVFSIVSDGVNWWVIHGNIAP
ncbi:MAG: hypothetical protein KDC12_03885 [Flavobacteriales bacterium]|nr:hypothetical protein [Flavobacteriales bacterium]